MEENSDIKKMLKKYKISYSELIKYLTNFSHTNRISEELAKPLSEKRRKEYIAAIKKIKQKTLEILNEDDDE